MLRLITLPALLFRLLDVALIGTFYFIYLELLGLIVYLLRGPEVYRIMRETEPKSELTWGRVSSKLIKLWWYK